MKSLWLSIVQTWRSLVNPIPSMNEQWMLDEYGKVDVIQIFPPLHEWQGNEYAISFVPDSEPDRIPIYWDLEQFRQQGYPLYS